MSDETRETRVKRLRMRAWHRGTKEMDFLLGGWADSHLTGADDAALDLFERVLAEDDHDLYHWVSGQRQAPEYMSKFVKDLEASARDLWPR